LNLLSYQKEKLHLYRKDARLKADRQKDPGAKQDFERAIERIHTIAFLHEPIADGDAGAPGKNKALYHSPSATAPLVPFDPDVTPD
jgi:hypothetical protein